MQLTTSRGGEVGEEKIVINLWYVYVLYIDDGIVMVQGRKKSNMESKVVRESLGAEGVVVNEEKSCWESSQYVVWLGFISNTGTGCICIPEVKLVNLYGILQKAACIYELSN